MDSVVLDETAGAVTHGLAHRRVELVVERFLESAPYDSGVQAATSLCRACTLA